MTNGVESLRQAALARVRAGEVEDAVVLYDQALALATDDEVIELLTINKADALITLERQGPEVQALPAILMRRRNLRHTFLASYALMYKFRLQSERRRAIFYGEVALEAAKQASERLWEIGATNELGILCEIDSDFPKAISYFERALVLIEELTDRDEHTLTYGIALQNLGASKVLAGSFEEGVELSHRALPSLNAPGARAEAFVDLCYGYLALENLAKAREFGNEALSIASDERQIRNAHYLLGEVAFKAGDEASADRHFDELARYYPGFRNLKTLLMAVDLRGMINLKL